jgi:hypothetical protein
LFVQAIRLAAIGTTAAANAPNVARSLLCDDRQTTHTSQIVPATIITTTTGGHRL